MPTTRELVPPTPIPAEAGIGLRFAHHRVVLDEKPRVSWFEVHAENYFRGVPLAFLEEIRRDYPISLHGVGLSLGSAERLDREHLGKLRALADRIQPGLVSEHLAWSGWDAHYLADLLPLPLTEEALDIFCHNVDAFQSALGRRVLVENPSTYLQFAHSTMPEWEFLAEVVRRTGCGLLCDVNNIFVSAANHGFDGEDYLAEIPPEAVGEIHLAGHTVRTLGVDRRLLIDDHGSRVAAPVWALYAKAIARFGPVPTLIEWDTRIPSFAVLEAEATGAKRILRTPVMEV